MGNLLNLERVPALAPKFANQIGKTAAAFMVVYAPEGVKVEVRSLLDKDGKVLKPSPNGENLPCVSTAEWERRRALHNTPSEGERLTAMVRKFELRLNKECKTPPASGKEAAIQEWIATLPVAERRALLMSQKDFSKSYPDGFRP
jgi:hypothetical protein